MTVVETHFRLFDDDTIQDLAVALTCQLTQNISFKNIKITEMKFDLLILNRIWDTCDQKSSHLMDIL